MEVAQLTQFQCVQLNVRDCVSQTLGIGYTLYGLSSAGCIGACTYYATSDIFSTLCNNYRGRNAMKMHTISHIMCAQTKHMWLVAAVKNPSKVTRLTRQ